MKFLIIRFSPVGDIVQASPLVRGLRKRFPGAVIHFLCDDNCRSAVEFNPHIDKLHVLAHSPELMIEELRLEEYDHIIDLQHTAMSLQVSRALGKKPFLAGSNSFWKTMVGRFQHTHLVEQQFRAVRSFGVENDGAGLDYFIAPREETKKEDIPASHYAGYIACATGGDDVAKRWPVQHWKAFCAQLDHPVILLGRKEDRVTGTEIASVDDIKVYNACGKFSLNEMADLLRKAKLLVCNESEFMHIAAAYKRPVVFIKGKTGSSFNLYPYYGNSYLSGQQQRPYDILQGKRIGDVAVADVMTAVKKWL